MPVPLLNFAGGPGVPVLNFEGGPGIALLNFVGEGESRGLCLTFTPYLLLYFTLYKYLISIISSSHPEVFLRKGALQLYWNRTSTWLFSCRFAAYFQLAFPKNTSGCCFCISTFLLNVSSRSALLLKGPTVFSKQKTFFSVCIAFYFFSKCWF